MNLKSIFCVLFWISNVECLINNVSRLHQDFPSIKDGEPCVKGRMYRMACNTCHCADNNALYCTKMACLEEGDMLRLKLIRHHSLHAQRSGDGQKKLNKDSLINPRPEKRPEKLKKDILRIQNSGSEKKKSPKEKLKKTESGNKKIVKKLSLRDQKSGDVQKKMKRNSLINPGSEKIPEKLKKDILRTQKSGNVQMKLRDEKFKKTESGNMDIVKKQILRAQRSGDVQKKLKKNSSKKVGSENQSKKTKKDTLRSANEKNLKKNSLRSQVSDDPVKMIEKEDEKYLPIVPSGRCVPGKIYRQECTKCFCDDEGKPTCAAISKTGCNDYPKPSEVVSPNDVIPRIPNEVFWKLPILAHSAAACTPGKIYMVTCNVCLCLDNGNLLCEQLLCIDQEEMNHAKAKKWSGAPCKKGDSGLSTRCVRCQCVSDVTSCHPMPGCVEPKVLKLHGDSKARMSLDTSKEKCEPGTVYRVDCNFCYCQPNRMLRCTRKSCLNFRQALMLKKQRSYLEKHGL